MGRAREFARRNLWSDEEDEMLKQAVAEHGHCWVKVAKLVPDRTPGACSDRWRNHIDPSVAHPGRVPFSKFEIAVVYKGQQSLGNNWAEIAKQLPGRTNVHVKGLYEGALCKGRRASDNRFMDFSFQQLVTITPNEPGQEPEQLPNTDQSHGAGSAPCNTAAAGCPYDPSSPVACFKHNSGAMHVANRTDDPGTPCHASGYKRHAAASNDSPHQDPPATYKRQHLDFPSLGAEQLQNNFTQYNQAVQCVTPSRVYPGALDPVMSLPRINTGVVDGLTVLGDSPMQARSPVFNHMVGMHSPGQRLAAAAGWPPMSPSTPRSYMLQQMLQNQMPPQQPALLQGRFAAQMGGLYQNGGGASNHGCISPLSPFAAAQGQGFGVLLQQDSFDARIAQRIPVQMVHTQQQQQVEVQAGRQVQQPQTRSSGAGTAPVQGVDSSVLPDKAVDLGLLPFPSVNLIDILNLQVIDGIGLEAMDVSAHACQVATGKGEAGGALHVQPGSTPAAGSIMMQSSGSLDVPKLFAAGSMPSYAGVGGDDESPAEDLLLGSLLDSQGSGQSLVGAADRWVGVSLWKPVDDMSAAELTEMQRACEHMFGYRI